MSGNPMYGWPPGNSISQWHQQGPPPQPSNTMHYSGSVPNNSMIGMPSSEALQPSMQSVQPIHSMPIRQPHQSLQQQQMPRTSGLYQPIQPTANPSQSQLPQQNSQFQQHPQQSHYSQYSPPVLASQYWASPMTQQPPLGTLPSPQTTPSGFQQHHGIHQQSPTASPLPHQSVRGHTPTSHTPDRSNIPPITATSSVQQAASTFANSKDHTGTDQQMISSLSRQGLQQQHSSSSMQMRQQNSSSASSINTLPVSPTHGPTASQMRSMQQPQQPASNWQQTNQYYQQQNQSRFPFAGSVNSYMPYGGTSGSDMPNNIAAPTAQPASTRHMIGQKPGIDNNDRTVRSSSSGWPPISGNLYSQQQQSAQGGGNNNYYGYDSSSYYSMPGQSNVDTSQSLNNANNNIHQNQYWNTPLNHGQSPAPSVNRPMSNSLQHHSLVQQSPSASPLPQIIRNQPPAWHTPDRSPSLGNIPPHPVTASSFPGPGQQSAAATSKNAGGSNSLAQLEQMVMPHLGGTTGVVKSPSHRSSTSSPIINSAISSGGGINQQLPYSTNYNSTTSDTNSASYFNSNNSGQGQQQHSYFPQYGSGSSEIPKTSSMWPDQTSPQTGPSASGPSSSMIDTSSQYGQSNQYETQPNAAYGDYTSAPLPTSSHDYSHMSQSETTSAPAAEVADPYAIDFQTFEDYDEQPSTLKSKKGRPKKGENNETKKERKPRAPRASKAAAGPKGKKAKANAIMTEQSVDQTLHPVQFETSNIVSNEYNQSMINHEHYPTPQDPYSSNNTHLNQPEPQNMYDQTNLSNLQSTIKPVDNQQLDAPQEYMPYSDYTQPNSKPSEPLEGHQNQQDDNPIENSIETSDKIEVPTFQDTVTNSQLQENNNGEAVSSNASHSVINSPIVKNGIPKCVTPSIHESGNKQTQDTSITVSDANTLEALSTDSIAPSENVNLVSDTTANHLNLTDNICDETSLEHTQENNTDHNIQNDSMQMHVMETSGQPSICIPSQTHTNTYPTQQSHHHSASPPPSVYGPSSQPSIPNQIISSPPSHSPTRAPCPTRSVAMPGQSPNSMVKPMNIYGNPTMTHQGLNDNGSSQNLPPTSTGYLMNSPNQYQSVQAQQQSIMDANQSHSVMNSSEPTPYQTMTNQSHIASSTSPPFMSEPTSLSGQIDEAQPGLDESMSTFNGDQTLVQQIDTASKKAKNRTMQKQSVGDSNHSQLSSQNQPESTPPPLQNVDNQSSVTSSSHSTLLDSTTMHDQPPPEPTRSTCENTSSNIEKNTVTSNTETTIKDKTSGHVPHKRKIKSKSNNTTIDNDLSEAKARETTVKSVDACTEGPKTDSEIDESLKNTVGDAKPKLKRKRPSESSGDKPSRRRKKTESCEPDLVQESLNTASAQQTKLESVVSPALSLSSTSTNSIAKQDLSPSLSSDKPVICLISGSGSSISPATKATSNGSGSSGGSGHKSSRRRSSERKESVIEGLMRTTDFVIAKKDLKDKNPHLWRIEGNNLLQQFEPIEPAEDGGLVLYENTHQYKGWNPIIKGDYIGVDVKVTHHSRNQIQVERLSLNLQTPKEAIEFYDSHYAVYIQILLNMCLDNQFWSIPEPDNLDYYLSSSRVIDDVIQRNKAKLISKVKLDQEIMSCLDRYPNTITKEVENEEKEHHCMGCQNVSSAYITIFTKESYERKSLKAIEKSTDQQDLKTIRLCNSCNEKVRLYSEMQHFKWKLYIKANEKVLSLIVDDEPQHSVLLDKCMKDKEWISMMFEERDRLWEKVERAV